MPRPRGIIAIFWIAASTLLADQYSPPSDYYKRTISLQGSTLDSALNATIRSHTVRTYDQLRQDLAVTDRDWAFPPPENSATAITKILLVYSEGWSGYSRSGVWDSGSTWNREHCWPDSRGVGQPDSGPDFSDMHHLRAANPTANSSRSNRYFDVGATFSPVTQAPLANWTSETWEPPDTDKGWIARACLYMATRYDGTEANTTDLILVETPPSSTTGNPPQMGRKSTLLLWNRLHPPSLWERRRNQLVYDLYQQNRNPFIDYPEFADVVYEAPLGRETRQTWRYRHFSLAELDNETVSGDLADPDGDGMPNLLEFALGALPRAHDPAAAPALQRTSNGSLRFTYRRQRDRALSAINYVVETATTPAGPWTSLTNATETLTGTVGTVETITVEPSAAPPTLFMRLRVTR
jgi:endonuclease I